MASNELVAELDDSSVWGDMPVDPEIEAMTDDDLKTRATLIENDISMRTQKEKIKENLEKVKLNKQLPYLVANIVEIMQLPNKDAQRATKSAVIKTSTRQTVFLPVIGLVSDTELKPSDLVVEYDSRVKAMEVDERPTEEFSDIGGLDKQIQELLESVVLPMTAIDQFDAIGILPPKGVLMACAKHTDALFLKLAGPQLVQMFIGDGAKLVRDAFDLAKEKIDAIGTKRFDSDQSGDREVQRTMLELLNQLDGFDSNTKIKVIAATNRPDVLDPALLRSGRLDRKIELPHPIHKLARMTDDFNGAQLKAVCVEAGMLALRRDADSIGHEDFVEGVTQVQQKKKASLQYYA
eukprot:GSMAST32.ASY1.ANO1.973.1 assembled CDS